MGRERKSLSHGGGVGGASFIYLLQLRVRLDVVRLQTQKLEAEERMVNNYEILNHLNDDYDK